MLSRSKLFAAFLITAAMCVGAIAQAPRVEGFTFTTDGGYLGVQTQEVTKDNFSKFGLREVRGVAIEKVVENSPAAKAGLQDNDVIVRFNGEEVTSTRKLTRLIGEVAPDHQVRITVLRNGSEREISATLGKRPGMTFSEGMFRTTVPSVPSIPSVPSVPRVWTYPEGTVITPEKFGEFYSFGAARQIGVSVSTLGKQLGDYFGVAEGKGLLINNVRENSAASKAGLRAGDVIVEVDGKAVSTTGELSRAINEKKEGDVSLTIIRNKNRQTIRVTPEKGAGSENLQRLREMMTEESRVRSQALRQLQLDRQRFVPSRIRRAPRTL